MTHSALMFSCLFFSVGLLCCYQVIVFSAGTNTVALRNLGVRVAFLNCINMLSGSFFHTCIGKIMDFFWPLFYCYKPFNSWSDSTIFFSFYPFIAKEVKRSSSWGGAMPRRYCVPPSLIDFFACLIIRMQ